MSGGDLAGALAGACGTGAGALRMWRVAQREHYYAGGATRFALRWWRSTPLNTALALAGVAGLVGAAFAGWPAALTGLVAVVGPVGLGLRGRTSRLAWTRRLRTLAGATGLLVVVCALAAGLGGGARPLAVVLAFSALAVPLVVDLALVLLAPLEARLVGRYVARAREVLRRVHPQVVAITGSYGKTSTKGYLAHLLAGRLAVVASPKSFNNRAGLARTVNEHLVPGTEVLIAEMGTYGPGEIAALCAWLPPSVSVLTAIGPVHLERFKSLDRTLAAKSEIVAEAAHVVCNVDDARLAGLADRLEAAGRRVWRASAGTPAPGGARAADVVVVAEGEKLSLSVDGAFVGATPLAKGDNVPAPTNVACAVAAALALGARPEDLLGRLGGLPVADNRLSRSVTPRGVVVLDDTFNSNPAGARLALAELERQALAGARRVVVTPGMVELGPLQFEENAAFGAAAAAVATDLVVVARTNRRALVAGARRAQGERSCNVVVTADRDAAVAWVRANLGEGDIVLYENDLPDHFP